MEGAEGLCGPQVELESRLKIVLQLRQYIIIVALRLRITSLLGILVAVLDITLYCITFCGL